MSFPDLDFTARKVAATSLWFSLTDAVARLTTSSLASAGPIVEKILHKHNTELVDHEFALKIVDEAVAEITKSKESS